jgi:polyphosphate kinase
VPLWLLRTPAYAEKLDDAAYEADLHNAHLQLALLQDDLANTGKRIVIVFEGRDAAGKGGAIRTYLYHLNPRYSAAVALPKPSDRERTQWYFQRYVDWLPASGEQVLFDRSWYNRAGVEPVMGFCTMEETERFLHEAPAFERMLVRDGIHLFKFWLSIGREMQQKRFHDRRHDPLKRWKLSPVDLKALDLFDAYTEARDRMFERTHNADAPWHVVLNNDKARGRLAVLRTVLHSLDYVGKNGEEIGTLDESIVMPPDRFLARSTQD